MATQALGDALAGAFGHGVDRPALQAFVANSQATNGLRSAQTEEAMNNAQMQQEEMQAHGDLESSLTGALGDDGKPLLSASGAHLVANELVGHFGDAKSVMQAYREAQQSHNTSILSNPANLNTAADTAAAAGNTNKVPEAVQVPNEYAVPAGVTPPTVMQTPLGAAQTAAAGANAQLHTAQADNPQLFHPGAGANGVPPDAQAAIAQLVRENPNLAGNLRSLVSNGGWGVAYNLATGHPYSTPGGAPSGSPAAPQGAGTQQPLPTPPNGIVPAPGVSLHEQAAIRGDFANGIAARQASSLNTMVNHSQLFDAIADQLDNGNSVPTNWITQKWQQTFGSPVPTNLKIAGQFLGNEAVRATVNSGAGTGAERELQVNADSSPDQLHGAAQTLRTLAAGQLQSLDLRARRGGVDIAQLLSPDAQKAFGRSPLVPQQGGGPALETPSGPGVLPNPANPADPGPNAGVVPDGTTAINRQTGVRMIRKGGIWQLVQ